jgi:hypothetical protein
MLEVISIAETQKWDAVVQSMYEYDFYHLNAYHRLDTSGQPYLLHFQSESAAFCLPLILRKIKSPVIAGLNRNPMKETDYHDITSVYGYAGALSNVTTPAQHDIQQFHSALQNYFDEQNIVSVFARLHPLFDNQASILSGLGEVVDLNKTVGIDLTLPENEQRAQFSHSLKNDLNRAKRLNLLIRQAENPAEIDAFIELYYATMQRVQAQKMYFFSREYFLQFLATIPSFVEIAILDGQIISGSLCTMCNGIIQSHLSATATDFLKISPIKSVWNEVRLFGIQNQFHFLHFGGGSGGQDDTLFAFKAQFSKQIFLFKIWKYIHNSEVYEELTQKNHGNLSDYFPAYRG